MEGNSVKEARKDIFQENLSAYSEKGWDLANGLRGWPWGEDAHTNVQVPV